MSQIRSRELYMSSILPAITTLGMADAKPVMARPTTAAAGCGTAAIKTQNTLKTVVLIMYSFFRPNVSEYGGKTTFPTPWTKENLV